MGQDAQRERRRPPLAGAADGVAQSMAGENLESAPGAPAQPPVPSGSYPRFGASQRSASWSGIPLRRA